MTGIICNFLDWLAAFIVDHVPAIAVGSDVMDKVSSAVEFLMDVLSNCNWLFPVSDALVIISVLFGIHLVKLLIFIVNWIIRRIADVIP